MQRRRRAHQLARRDQQLAGLTYGANGGLAGYGTFEELGAFNTFGTPMQNGRDPGVRGGGGIDTPPPRLPPGALGPTVTGGVRVLGPRLPAQPGVSTPPRFPVGGRPMPGGPITPGSRIPVSSPTGAPIMPTRGGWTGGGSGGGGSGGGGGGGGSDGSGAGVVTGGPGSDTSGMTPPPDVPDAPAPADNTISIAGYAVPKAAVYGGVLLGAFLLWRKR